jgi:pimeloyl-ACP methyl ester carboxylesterase
VTRIEERTATLRSGLTLPYAEAGQPDSSVPVVLVHAYVETWRYFAPLLRALPSNVHVFAPTLRGHPSVVGDVSGFGIDDVMADVADFLDARGLTRVVLVGASSGGLLCQRLAVQRPERVVGLVLVSSPVALADKPGVLAMAEEIGALTDPVDRGFVERFVSDTSPSSMAREQVEALVDETLAIPARVWREAFRGLLEAAAVSLEELDAPTLLLAGGDDGIVGTDQQLLVSRIPQVELVEYAGIGHAPHLAHPDRVAADLVRFVQRLPSA